MPWTPWKHPLEVLYRPEIWLTDFNSTEIFMPCWGITSHTLGLHLCSRLHATTFCLSSNKTTNFKRMVSQTSTKGKQVDKHMHSVKAEFVIMNWTPCFLSHNTQPTVQFYKVPEECISCYLKHITSRAHERQFVSSFYNKLRGLSSLMAY